MYISMTLCLGENLTLPDDLLWPVLAYLDARDLCTVSRVSHHLEQCGSSSHLWRKLIAHTFDHDASFFDDLLYPSTYCFDPKQVYFTKYRLQLCRIQQEAKRKIARKLNWTFVRATDCILSSCSLLSIVLAYAYRRDWTSLLPVFLPLFIAEAWMLLVVVGITLALHFRPGRPSWVYISDRIQGPMNWILTNASTFEAIVIVTLLSGAIPSWYLALAGYVAAPVGFVSAFACVWLAGVVLFFAWLRRNRQTLSMTSIVSGFFVWAPLFLSSVMYCMNLCEVTDLSAFWILSPYLLVLSLSGVLISVLLFGSIGMYCARYGEWIEYTFAALTLTSALTPFLVAVVVVLGYCNGTFTAEIFFGYALSVAAAGLLSALWRARSSAGDEYAFTPIMWDDDETELLLPDSP